MSGGEKMGQFMSMVWPIPANIETRTESLASIILDYIFRDDIRSMIDMKWVLHECAELSYKSLDGFIPQLAKAMTPSMYPLHFSNGNYNGNPINRSISKIGDRFVLKENPAVRGTLVDFLLEYDKNNKQFATTLSVQLKKDISTTRGNHPQTFKIDQLIPERVYLEGLLELELKSTFCAPLNPSPSTSTGEKSPKTLKKSPPYYDNQAEQFIQPTTTISTGGIPQSQFQLKYNAGVLNVDKLPFRKLDAGSNKEAFLNQGRKWNESEGWNIRRNVWNKCPEKGYSIAEKYSVSTASFSRTQIWCPQSIPHAKAPNNQHDNSNESEFALVRTKLSRKAVESLAQAQPPTTTSKRQKTDGCSTLKLYSVSNTVPSITQSDEYKHVNRSNIAVEEQDDNSSDFLKNSQSLSEHNLDREISLEDKQFPIQFWSQERNLTGHNAPKIIEKQPEGSKIYSAEDGPILSTASKCGPGHGIHGKRNSCYMDSLLFTWLYSTSIFDHVLLISQPKDTEMAKTVKHILKDKITQPLREKGYCSAENVDKLRKVLANAFNQKLWAAMMDVEELIYILLENALQAPEWISYEDNNTKDFVHALTIYPEMLPKIYHKSISVETSLRMSIQNFELQFAHTPFPALMVQMMRSDGDLVHFKSVVPNATLKLEGMIKPETCKCGRESGWESREGTTAITTKTCEVCLDEGQSQEGQGHGNDLSWVSRKEMDLQAVICISCSHYTTYVKDDKLGEWLFFDSMAGSGPEVQLVPKLDTEFQAVSNLLESNRLKDLTKLSSHMRNIMQDCHICIYQPRKWTKRL